MNLYLKFNANIACKKIIQEQLDKFRIDYEYLGFGEVAIENTFPGAVFNELTKSLSCYGIEVIAGKKNILVQKIKDTITEMVYMEDKITVSNSTYISKKLRRGYKYIASVFSEVTFTSIENFIILQKTERAKQLIITDELNFSEIAYMLNYSSVAHFSSQFKSVTGITPTAFKRIINRRREKTINAK